MKYTHILYIGVLLSCLTPDLSAQGTSLDDIRETPEKAGSVYYAYPSVTEPQTAAPKGYKPFYISHYGRHGSRYLIGDQDYKVLIDRFHDAQEKGALTPLGVDVLNRLDSVWLEAEGRGGELTPLGNRQHRGIARRMYTSFPEVFAAGAKVKASSTTVMRCAHSMFAFIEGLKEMNPGLDIPRESGNRNMVFLNYHSPEANVYSSHNGPWYQTYLRFKAEKTNPDRLIGLLFSDSEYVKTWVNCNDLMWQLYWLAVDMQNMETQVSFLDLFTAEELYDLFKVVNFNFFATNSSYAPAQGKFLENCQNLINDIIDNADEYISTGSHGATLRFGHDGNITPLTAAIQIEGCHTGETDPEKLSDVWSTSNISPMASNLQIVFYKNKEGDVLAKIMLNEREVKLPVETDIYPYYHWNDLRKHLDGIANPEK